MPMPLRREDAAGTPHVTEGRPLAAERVDGAQDAAAPAAISDLMGEGQAEVRANARPAPPRFTKEEMENHNLTRVVFRNRCRCCVAMRTREQPHHLVRSEDGTWRVMMDWMFFTSDDRVGFTMSMPVVNDLVSVAVTAIHEARRCKLWWQPWRHVDTQA